jgi:hypothetical protein
MRLRHQTGFRTHLLRREHGALLGSLALLSSTENSHTPKKPMAMENSAGEA